MKKKITLEELLKRVEELEKNRIIVVPQVPQFPPYPIYQQCTCNTSIFMPCPVHGYPQRYTVTC